MIVQIEAIVLIEVLLNNGLSLTILLNSYCVRRFRLFSTGISLFHTISRYFHILGRTALDCTNWQCQRPTAVR